MTVFNHQFRDPIFVRNDEKSEIKISTVVWAFDGGVSVKFTNGSGESVLVDADDWQQIVAAVDLELGRVS